MPLQFTGYEHTNELLCGESHLSGEVGRQDVTKVACGCDGANRLANSERVGLTCEGEVGPEVENGLGQNSRPVDRVTGIC